ncbi:MAG: hypothetical protein ABSD89_09185 [Halobacteriota archaeon]|jgi:hypothetical protein
MNDISASIQTTDTSFEPALEQKLQERIRTVMEDAVLQQSSALTPWDYVSLVLVALVLPIIILIWGWY